MGRIGRHLADSRPWWEDAPKAAPGSPNVAFIVFDDAGYSDWGCFGSEIETPNLDQLAANGLRYSNFHTTALCSPTRAAMLTGRNHHAVGVRVIADFDTGFPNGRGCIPPTAATLPQLLRGAGYNTLAVGKWHLAPTEETSSAGPFANWPLQKGFDRYYGFLGGETDQWYPELVCDNRHVSPPRTPAEGYHLSSDLVDRAIQMITEQHSALRGKPFFLNLAFGAVHAPHHAPAEAIAKYRAVFDKGWDQTRIDRLARQKAMGLMPPTTELPPRHDGVPRWAELPANERRLFARLQEAYAGFVEHTDTQIGRLLDFLTHADLLDNTLVFAFSDNGASMEGGRYGTVMHHKAFNLIPEELAENLERLDAIGSPLVNNHYPTGWAMASNTPFKRFKSNTHAGGISDPLVVHWPAGFAARGEIRPLFCHAVDLMPTVLDIVGVDAPTTFEGVEQQPITGVSFANSFANRAAPTKKHAQYFEMFGSRGIWSRGWKAVTYHAPDSGANFDDDTWELYFVDEDWSECHDLAAQHPEKLRELIDLWRAEAAANAVLPLDDRRDTLPWGSRRTGAPRFRDHWVLYRGAYLPAGAAPIVQSRSHTITVEVERADTGEEGVLLAYGGLTSGFTFYVKDNRLRYDYNFFGNHTVLTSDRDVPVGKSRLRFVFARRGSTRGIGGFGAASLFIDDTEVGRAQLTRTMPATISTEGLSVGYDAYSPASPDYDNEFPFTGTLHRALIDLEPRRRDATADAKE